MCPHCSNDDPKLLSVSGSVVFCEVCAKKSDGRPVPLGTQAAPVCGVGPAAVRS